MNDERRIGERRRRMPRKTDAQDLFLPELGCLISGLYLPIYGIGYFTEWRLKCVAARRFRCVICGRTLSEDALYRGDEAGKSYALFWHEEHRVWDDPETRTTYTLTGGFRLPPSQAICCYCGVRYRFRFWANTFVLHGLPVLESAPCFVTAESLGIRGLTSNAEKRYR